jgi:membrane-bound lytic murein transglycosylase A
MALTAGVWPFAGRAGRRIVALTTALLTAFVLFAAIGARQALAKPDISALQVDRVAFDSLPGWQDDDHLDAFNAFLQSCRQVEGQTDALAAVCRSALRQPASMTTALARDFFESHFQPHRVLSGSGLITGYYEPVLRGSRVRTKEYGIPLYRRPDDLVSLNSGSMRSLARRSGLSDELTYARRVGSRLEPFMTREAIESGGLAGRSLEMLWLADPVDAFFLHIQGSGIITLPDGQRIRIGFDGKNGYDYTSVGKVLVQSGMLAGNEATLDGVKHWLRANPDEGRRVMWRNRSFIFFREIPNREGTEGPIGAAGVPLVGGRSLAVDLRHYRLGLPIFLAMQGSPQPGERHLRRLMIAQDTGTAIKGPQRGDIFWGSGRSAGEVAGGTYNKGDFYVLLPRRTPKFSFPGTSDFAPFKTISF